MTPGAELHGITVVDASRLGPGPYATSLLVQLGAEVVKVEEPGRGDYLRQEPPLHEGVGHLFSTLNRGKRSMTADLKSAPGRERVRDLVRSAHVFIESFRPGTAERLGIGYKDLRAVNPSLVYCSINGWGTDPEPAGHDLTYLAQTGYLAASAKLTGGPPVPPAALLADFTAGQAAALRIVAALVSGAPRRLEIHIAQAALAIDPIGVARHLAGISDDSKVRGDSPRYRVYRCRNEQYLAVGALEDKFWWRFLDLVGVTVPAGADDVAVTALVEPAVAQRTGEEWRRTLASADVCAAVVDDLERALPDLLSRFPDWWLRDLDGRAVGVALPGSPGVALAAAPDMGDLDATIDQSAGTTWLDRSETRCTMGVGNYEKRSAR